MTAERTVRWCNTHDDVAVVYDDGSVTCQHDLVVETSNDVHELVDLPEIVKLREALSGRTGSCDRCEVLSRQLLDAKHRSEARDRVAQKAFGDLLDLSTELVAMYPDMCWDEALASAVEELTETRTALGVWSGWLVGVDVANTAHEAVAAIETHPVMVDVIERACGPKPPTVDKPAGKDI